MNNARLYPLLIVACVVWACSGPQPVDPEPTTQPAATSPHTMTAAPPVSSEAAAWPTLAPLAQQGGGQSDAAIIIGISDYAFAPDIPGATQNAEDWYQYFVKTRQIAVQNVQLLRDNEASLELMEEAAQAAVAQVQQGGTLWVVFIGHGAPSRSDGVLIGVDAQQNPKSLYARSLSQQRLVELLRGPQQQTVLIIDACFSGKVSDDAMFADGLQPLIPVEMPSGVTVLSAGAADEFAGPLLREPRPAFSYLVLGALRGWADADGDLHITAQEAVAYARDVLRATVKDRKQTPELNSPSPGLILASLTAPEAGPDVAQIVLNKPTKTPNTKPPEITPTTTRDPNTRMVEVPEGEFLMGCNEPVDPACEPDEFPSRKVYLDAFLIDQTEVTVAAYEACTRVGYCTPPATDHEDCSEALSNWNNPSRADHPINCVTWFQAQTYCAWVNKSVPTEAQWEKAARGPYGNIYPWGHQQPTCATAVVDEGGGAGCGTLGTMPVGSKPQGASPYGALDMVGNVSEWTADWYDIDLSATTTINPKGPPNGLQRAVRDGSFYSQGFTPWFRASARFSAPPLNASDGRGFRCAARSIP